MKVKTWLPAVLRSASIAEMSVLSPSAAEKSTISSAPLPRAPLAGRINEERSRLHALGFALAFFLLARVRIEQ
jgi:hypothetical protein